MPIEVYTGARCGDIFAIRGTHAVNIDLVRFPTKSIFCVLILIGRAKMVYLEYCWCTREGPIGSQYTAREHTQLLHVST